MILNFEIDQKSPKIKLKLKQNFWMHNILDNSLFLTLIKFQIASLYSNWRAVFFAFHSRFDQSASRKISADDRLLLQNQGIGTGGPAPLISWSVGFQAAWKTVKLYT